MNRSLWISKTGMDAQQLQMDVISNNLANVGTNGFKASRAVFEDLIYQTLRAPGAPSSTQTNLPSGLQVGTGVLPVALGEATKTVGYVMDGTKTYRFSLRWGAETTTDDSAGTVTVHVNWEAACSCTRALSASTAARTFDGVPVT